MPHSKAPHGVHCTGVTGGSTTDVVVVVGAVLEVGVLVEGALDVFELEGPEVEVIAPPLRPSARPAAGAHALSSAAMTTTSAVARREL